MTYPVKLTEHFSYREMIRSQKATRAGIPNDCPEHLYPNLVRTAEVMEQARSVLGDLPCSVSSGYRSPRVNRLVGGSRNSAHQDARACDFSCDSYGSAHDVATLLQDKKHLVEFDVVIFEGGWVHLSIARLGKDPRGLTYTAHFSRWRRTRYTSGINAVA